MNVVEDIQAKESKLHDEVSTVTMMRHQEEEPCKLRGFLLEKLQKDPFFKSSTIDRASTNIKIKDIVNILDRNEATMDQTQDGI